MANDDMVGPVVDLGWIFSGPIEAVIRANIMAAQEFVEFLETYAFVRSGEDPTQILGELRMVTFSFEQADENGLPVTRLFKLPLASIIPLPLLEVKDAVFDFGVRVLAAVADDPPPQRVGLLRAIRSPDPDETPVRWRAMLARKAPESADHEDLTPHLAANMHAKVTVGQADIPAGIRNLLAVMGENAQMTPAILTVQPPRLNLPAEDPTANLAPPRTFLLTTLTTSSRLGRPPITAYYDDTLVRLATTDGEPWPPNTARPAGADGRLEAGVGRRPGIAAPLETTIVFRVQAEGIDAVITLPCTFRALPQPRTPT